jgi:ADP-heptose:LPS heptosyltransferase
LGDKGFGGKKVNQLFSYIKVFIKFLLHNIIDFLVFLQFRIGNKIGKNTKQILLIRLDAIGDYILFRNFIEVLKRNSKYSDYKITLLGNIVWKDIAENLDKNYIDNFIWIDIKKFSRNLFYRYKKMIEIISNNYELLIHPTYSRTYDADKIVNMVNAKIKIGSIGDLSNIKKWQKKISDKYYTLLIPSKKEIMFEFYRNKEFFEGLLNEKVEISKPYIKILEAYNFSLKLPDSNYVLLFISASSKIRKWNIKNFAELAKWIKNNLNYEIALCGGREDIKEVNIFEEIYGNNYFNLVGKTTLTDLIFILKNSKMIISNETFVPHMAVALGLQNIFVIYNGNHFGRFIPYPSEMVTSYFPIYHPEIEKNLENYKILSNNYGYGSKLDINEISIENVINKIKIGMKI